MKEFDAGYFNISSREASHIDPQNRILLECTVNAFDDAGVDPKSYAGKSVAVFVGQMTHDYIDLLTNDINTTNPGYATLGSARTMSPNRLSWYFDFRGPSLSVDTVSNILAHAYIF